MEQEVNLKTVAVAKQSYEEASAVFFKILKWSAYNIYNMANENKQVKESDSKPVVGKMVSVKELRKDESEIEYMDIENVEDMKKFRKHARQYGVLYSMEKNKATDPPTYTAYFKAKDSSLVEKAIVSFVADKVRDKANIPEKGVAANLDNAKSRTDAEPKKIKNKEQIR